MSNEVTNPHWARVATISQTVAFWEVTSTQQWDVNAEWPMFDICQIHLNKVVLLYVQKVIARYTYLTMLRYFTTLSNVGTHYLLSDKQCTMDTKNTMHDTSWMLNYNRFFYLFQMLRMLLVHTECIVLCHKTDRNCLISVKHLIMSQNAEKHCPIQRVR